MSHQLHNFQALFLWLKHTQAGVEAMQGAITHAVEHKLIREESLDYSVFETKWNEATAVLNAEQPQDLIQRMVRYEATLAQIAATPMAIQTRKVMPRISPLILAAGDIPERPTMEVEIAVCPVCGASTPLPIINGGGFEHKTACPVTLAQQVLTDRVP